MRREDKGRGMRVALLAGLLLGLFAAAAPRSLRDNRVEDERDRWAEFKQRFDKKYSSSVEENFRKFVFHENLHKITQHNEKYKLGLTTYKVKINQFGDMLFDEYKNYMHAGNRTLPKLKRLPLGEEFQPRLTDSELVDHIDWRSLGAVTPVQDQGLVCGSCWAFSATGALEGQYYRKTGVLTPLSAQSLIDCTDEYGNLGCGGGSAALSFQFAADRRGLESEAHYAYEGRRGECPYKPSADEEDESPEASFVYVDRADERALKLAVGQVGPLSAAIDGSHDTFRFYSEGIYYQPECNDEDLDHAVLIVGYGTDSDNRDYWLVKNSWGEAWGEAGYFRIARNRHNHCGIASAAIFPVVGNIERAD